jgi:DNA-binding LacI/PurR family transcriptional regulator
MEALPKYRQIADDIRKRIRSGNYPQGEKIPSENDFVKEFKVSKHTVLKAFSELINEGMIRREQGKGTFACELSKVLKKQIAVIVYHSDNVYFSKVVRGIEDYFNGHEFSCILCNSEGNPEKEIDYVKRLIDTVDGFILCPIVRKGVYGESVSVLKNSGVPFVFVSGILQDCSDEYSYVAPDDCTGGFLATKHLIECGYKEIKFLVPGDGLNTAPVKERLRGYRCALAEKKIPYRKEFVMEAAALDPGGSYEQDGYEFAGEIIRSHRGSTGLFVSGDPMAIGLMRGLRELGASIPGEIGICGFDDIDLARQYGIELTTVRQGMHPMGAKAAECLMARIKDNSIPPMQELTSVELIKRKTTKYK